MQYSSERTVSLARWTCHASWLSNGDPYEGQCALRPTHSGLLDLPYTRFRGADTILIDETSFHLLKSRRAEALQPAREALPVVEKAKLLQITSYASALNAATRHQQDWTVRTARSAPPIFPRPKTTEEFATWPM